MAELSYTTLENLPTIQNISKEKVLEQIVKIGIFAYSFLLSGGIIHLYKNDNYEGVFKLPDIKDYAVVMKLFMCKVAFALRTNNNYQPKYLDVNLNYRDSRFVKNILEKTTYDDDMKIHYLAGIGKAFYEYLIQGYKFKFVGGDKRLYLNLSNYCKAFVVISSQIIYLKR